MHYCRIKYALPVTKLQVAGEECKVLEDDTGTSTVNNATVSVYFLFFLGFLLYNEILEDLNKARSTNSTSNTQR